MRLEAGFHRQETGLQGNKGGPLKAVRAAFYADWWDKPISPMFYVLSFAPSVTDGGFWPNNLLSNSSSDFQGQIIGNAQ